MIGICNVQLAPKGKGQASSILAEYGNINTMNCF